MPRSHVTLLVLALVAGSHIARADEVPPEYACKVPPANSKMSVSFSPDTSILDLVAWVTGFTCKNVVVDAEARARVPKVTIVAPNKLTPKQALDLFVQAVQATGLAVTVKKDTISITLGKSMPRNCPALPPPPPPTPVGSVAPPSTAGTDDVDFQKAVDAGTRKIDDTHYEVTAALVDAILGNPMAVSKGARVVPNVKGGNPYGFKLYAIRPSSLFAKLGLQNGDLLVKVNGLDMSSPDKALDAYTKIRGSDKLVLDLERRGQPLTLTITIKKK